MKLIKTIFLAYLLLNLLSADYYLISPTQKALAHSYIANKEFLVLPEGIYKKQEYFEPVYFFPILIKQAKFKNNYLLTNIGSFVILEHKIVKADDYLLKASDPPINSAFLLKIKISSVTTINNLDEIDAKKIIFKLNNQYYLGTIQSNNLISLSTENYKIYFRNRYNDSNTELIIITNGKTTIYKKTNGYWVEYKDCTNKYSIDYLKKLTAEELEILRYEIAARHGKIFTNNNVQKYFIKENWYKPNRYFSEKMLSTKEKELIKLLYKMEGEKRRSRLKEKPEIILPQ